MNRTGEAVATEKTPFISRHEAAEYLRTSTRTVDRRIKDGSLKHYRFGRAVLLRREDLDSYLSKTA